MLQSIDTLIAFVVIMTVASLFVTIVVQMFSALSLRGKDLSNALALTFQTIEPTLAEKAHGLAATILSDPLLSDSTGTVKDKKNGAGSRSSQGSVASTDVFGAISLATTVWPQEVYSALRRLADGEDVEVHPRRAYG